MKRFTSAEQIITLIDRYKAEVVKITQKFSDKTHLAKQLSGTCEWQRVQPLRDEADYCLKQISWRETRLKNLGDKLSEFQTPQLPGVDNGDTSIPTS